MRDGGRIRSLVVAVLILCCVVRFGTKGSQIIYRPPSFLVLHGRRLPGWLSYGSFTVAYDSPEATG